MAKELLIRSHLGLGDALVCNAIVRHFSKNYDVTFLCKKHNQTSLAFLFRDDPKIVLHTTDNDRMPDDDYADAVTAHLRDFGKEVLCLGMYGDRSKYDPKVWDRSMYAQAGLDFQLRWNEFKCARQPSCELPAPKSRYVFVHDDPARGFEIPRERLPAGVKLVRPDPKATENLFAYWDLLENAAEIHVIDSCFAILADSLPELKAKRLVVHFYARAGALPPAYRKDWEVLKS